MSLIIKGMDMPKSCDTCPILKYNSSIHYCPLARTTMWGEDLAKGERSEGCPLVEVPAPHGDLIDRDYLLSSFVPSTEELVGMVLENSEAAKYTLAVAKVIENIVCSVPTIIEAEGRR